MKPELNFEAMYPRCSHRDAAGRQCRTPITDPRSSLCSFHFSQRAQKQADLTDVYAPLVRNSQGLQTAQGINFSLTNLYQLLAQNLISPRRAAVLAYINSLLLRTLPAIDADLAAGITDPTKSPAPPPDIPIQCEASAPAENSRPVQNSEAGKDLAVTEHLREHSAPALDSTPEALVAPVPSTSPAKKKPES